jgi:hypothetical protein
MVRIRIQRCSTGRPDTKRAACPPVAEQIVELKPGGPTLSQITETEAAVEGRIADATAQSISHITGQSE